MKCLFYTIVYILVPLNLLRARLIDRHFSACPHCSKQLIDDVNLRRLVEESGPTGDDVDVWLKVRAGIIGKTTSKRVSGFRLATIGMAAALVLAVLFVPFHKTSVDETAAINQDTKQSDQIIIKSVEVNSRPAKTFYFKSQDNNRLIVWVQ